MIKGEVKNEIIRFPMIVKSKRVSYRTSKFIKWENAQFHVSINWISDKKV